MRSAVTINSSKDEIIIKLKPEALYPEIIEKLKTRLPELKRLYKNAQNPILITGKPLTKKETVEIKNLIQDKINVEVKIEGAQNLGLHGIKKAFDKQIETSQTKFLRTSIRSGQKIEYEGSIVILGDVNFGGEVIAKDNIIVLGCLRGLAHAGAKGNKKAIIAASSIECLQLRIADKIKEFERVSDDEIIKRRNYAYIINDEIIIE